jgi:SAM-dependent methyltransferase
MPALILPDEALPYVLYQRTEYLSDRLIHRILNKVRSRFPTLQHLTTRFEASFYKDVITRSFSADMEKEAESLRPHLPSPCQKMLDIGCGVAGVDAFLSQQLEGRADIFLLDKTQVDDKVYYKFERRGSFYSSLQVARDLLIANHVSSDHIHLEEATEDGRIQAEQDLDLVISLISWGFHYPVETYLERVYTLLRTGGRLILDVRKDTDGEERIRRRFSQVERIQETKRSYRLLAIK